MFWGLYFVLFAVVFHSKTHTLKREHETELGKEQWCEIVLSSLTFFLLECNFDITKAYLQFFCFSVAQFDFSTYSLFVPRGGSRIFQKWVKGGANLLFGQIFLKTAWYEKNGPIWGGVSKILLFRSATGTVSISLPVCRCWFVSLTTFTLFVFNITNKI